MFCDLIRLRNKVFYIATMLLQVTGSCFARTNHILLSMRICASSFTITGTGNTLEQGSATYCPQARCSLSKHFTRAATFYCHPAHDLLLSFNTSLFLFSMIDMQQQTAKMILILFFEFLAKTFFVFILVFAMNSTKKKGQNIWRRPFFFLVFAINLIKKA